ncbi:tetratricopeptide repeat protein [Dactylosporangium sp. NBC_01737]|uniref:tetratricopeptide repeat protein n=1 Tax=Dactylosporangium sp. NBC_01737 TaxID=2975959 RepID=UPI002E106FB3|nr:tetratricopeptide repeat protein [Dactylosporangium sp. NBC_01737]
MPVSERLCEVYGSRPGKGLACGSGTLLSNGLVLTAAHVVAGDGVAVSVRRFGDRTLYPAEVVWQRWDEAADVALVRVEDTVIDPGDLPPLSWGRLVCDAPDAPVEAVGFPRFRVSGPGDVRETDHLVGRTRPLGLAKSGWLDVAVDSAPKPTATSKDSPWGGMSGAALFCNQLLVGVIAHDQEGFAADRVSAVDTGAFADDPQFAALVWPGDPQTRPGLGPAELTALQQDPEEPQSPAMLLRADAAVVPFEGREATLQQLDAWCGKDGSRSAWLLTGEGGQGKTRLARHFAGRMRRKGWATVVLARRDGAGTMQHETVRWLSAVRIPLLLVIDYAEERFDQLELLGAALTNRRQRAPLRVLLLARSDGEWRQHLPLGWDFATDGVVEEQLRPLTADPGAFDRAVTAFADRLARLSGFQRRAGYWTEQATKVHPPASLPTTTLGVQLAALVALLRTDHPATGAGVTPERNAMDFLLNRHESVYWRRLAVSSRISLESPEQRAAVAAACLVPAANEDEALAVLRRVPGIQADELQRTARWLQKLYPHRKDHWGTLQPDLLAEHLVATAVQKNQGLLPSLLDGVDQRQAQQAMTVLARASVHTGLGPDIEAVVSAHPQTLAPVAVRVAVETAEPAVLINALRTVVADRPDDLDLLWTIYRSIPHPTRVHVAFAAEVAERLVAATRSAAPHRDLGQALNNLAVRLRALGRTEEALEAAQEAVDIRQQLAADGTEQTLTDLATSLNNLSNCLGELGRREEGLTVRRQAVGACRQLPAAHQADLATALNNLSTDLAGLSTDTARTECHDAADEAVRIRRGLAGTDASFGPELAGSLNTLSSSLSGLGRFPDAVGAAREAVELYQTLAKDRPDAHLPGLAASLNNLTRGLVELGEVDESLRHSEEAVRLYRQLNNPGGSDAHRADLARALHTRADCLALQRRHNRAIFDLKAAAQLYRPLARNRPEVYRPDLLRVLRSLTDRLAEVHRSDEADEVEEEIRSLEET